MNKKKLLTICCCLAAAFLLTSPCFSDSEDRSLRSRVLDGRIGFFYLYHDPQTVVDIIKEVAALKEFEDRHYFFSALFKTYPQEALQWTKESQVRLEDHNSLIYALWASALKSEAISRAQKAAWPVKDIIELENLPTPVLEFPAEQRGYLPCMSCYFFVTGDARYISKIIDILDLTPEKVRPSFNLEQLKGDAQYDLMLLMFHHERAYQLSLKESQSRSGEAGRLLNAVIEQHNAFVKKASLPEQNGMLNGDILITDSPSFEEDWNTLPVDSGPIGKAISAIPYPRETLQIKIIPLFSGFALDQELNGHVTYDMDVYDPEGEKVGSFKEKLGLQRKIPSRFLVQAADNSITMKCEVPKDEKEEPETDSYSFIKPGVYKIQGIIKDHVGNRELKITKTLEVLPPED